MLHGLRRLVLAALLSLTAAPALAQPTTLPANSVICRLGISPGPPQACPLGVLAPALVPLLTPYFPGVASVDGATGTVAASTSDKVCFVSTAGSNAKSGLGRQTAKLTPQACEDSVATGGIVVIGAGSYTFSASYAKRPGVMTWCEPGATFTQGAAANLTLVNFDTNSAHGAGMKFCTINGNRTQQTFNSGTGIQIGAANNVVVQSNILTALPGIGIQRTTGLNARIVDNTISDFAAHGIDLHGTAAVDYFGEVVLNKISLVGAHCIAVTTSNSDHIFDNRCEGIQSLGITANVSGTAVTRTAGPALTTCQTGNFAIFGGGSGSIAAGTERFINTITDGDHMTFTVSGGTSTGVTLACGSGDMIGLDTTQHVEVRRNTITKGVSLGVSIANGTGGQNSFGNIVADNMVRLSGAACLSQQGIAGTIIDHNVFARNNINTCGKIGSVAGDANANVAMYFNGGAQVVNASAFENTVRDDGSATTLYIANVTDVGAGQVAFGKNYTKNLTNDGVQNGISSIALSAGWGTTASTSAVISQGWGFSFTITSAGTGQGASPTVTVNTRATPMESPVLYQCKMTNVTTLLADEQGSNASLGFFTFVGTPVAGSTYQVRCK